MHVFVNDKLRPLETIPDMYMTKATLALCHDYVSNIGCVHHAPAAAAATAADV